MTWEYFTHVIKSHGVFTAGFDAAEVSNALNWYGGQGWELVSTFVAATGNGMSVQLTLIFKRPGIAAPVEPGAGGA